MACLLNLISVLSQVAWTAPSLLFLMSWGRCVFMDGKVSVLLCSFGEGGKCFSVLAWEDDCYDQRKEWETSNLIWSCSELSCTDCSLRLLSLSGRSVLWEQLLVWHCLELRSY